MRGGDYINATLTGGFNVAGVESLHITTHEKRERQWQFKGLNFASIPLSKRLHKSLSKHH